MILAEDYNTASWRGISFIIESETTNGGKKIVNHEYPASDFRFSEELGLIPESFTINAVIHTSIVDRFTFETELKRPGLGELVHPVYGTLQCMTGPYSVSFNQNNLGEFKYSITFYTSKANITAGVEEIGVEKVSDLTGVVNESIGDKVQTTYGVTTRNINSLKDRMDNFLSTTQGAIRKIVNPIREKVSAFNSLVNTARTNLFSIMQNANTVRELFDSVLNSVYNIASTPDDLLDFWKDVLDFGMVTDPITGNPIAESPELPFDTLRRREIANGLSLIDEAVRLFALSGIAESLSYKTFATQTELQQAVEDYDDDFQFFINYDVDDRLVDFIVEDDTVRVNFYDLRKRMREVLDDKKQNTFRTETVNVNKTSMSLLSYQYYGSLGNLEILENLNPNTNSANVDGEVDIVE